jgi:hypothetical protein
MSRAKLKMTLVSSIFLLSLWSTPAWSNPLYGRYLVSTAPGLVVLIVNLPQLGDALGAFEGDTLLAFSLFDDVLPVEVDGPFGPFVMTTARGPLYVTDILGNWVYCCDVEVTHKAEISFEISFGFAVIPQEYRLELLGINDQKLFDAPLIPF